MELLVIVISLSLTGAQKSQLEGPENTLSVVGSTVTLKCSPPSRNCSGIDWQKYIPAKTPTSIFKGPRTILNTDVSDRDRYSVDNSSGCDLIIKNVQLTDAGRFICSAIMSSSQLTKTAHLIILETQPKCTLNVSLSDAVEGDGVQLKCEVTYIGANKASMNWKGVTDAPAAVIIWNRTISRSYSVVASAPEVPSFICEASFAYEVVYNFWRPVEGLATNSIPAPSCGTPVITIFHSVRNVTLSPSLSIYPPGAIVTCAARGHPPPTFKWQEMENEITWTDIQKQTSSEFTITEVLFKRYRCVATNVVRGKSYDATSDDIQFDNTDPVRDVTLSPSLSKYPPGTTITCAANGHPSPTFKWQEMESDKTWMDIRNQHDSEFTMTDVSSKRYRCVAMNVARGNSYNATSHEILVNNTDRLGIGFGIGFLIAILLAAVVFTVLVKVRCIDVHRMKTNKSADGDAQHMDQEMKPSSESRQRSPKTEAPLVEELESAYASLGEDRDANEYASLEESQKDGPKKKSKP